MTDETYKPQIENVDTYPANTAPAAADFRRGATTREQIDEALEARRQNQRDPADCGRKV